MEDKENDVFVDEEKKKIYFSTNYFNSNLKFIRTKTNLKDLKTTRVFQYEDNKIYIVLKDCNFNINRRKKGSIFIALDLDENTFNNLNEYVGKTLFTNKVYGYEKTSLIKNILYITLFEDTNLINNIQSLGSIDDELFSSTNIQQFVGKKGKCSIDFFITITRILPKNNSNKETPVKENNSNKETPIKENNKKIYVNFNISNLCISSITNENYNKINDLNDNLKKMMI